MSGRTGATSGSLVRVLLAALLTAAVAAGVVGLTAGTRDEGTAAADGPVAATPTATATATEEPTTPLEAFGTAAPLDGAPDPAPTEAVAAPTSVSVPVIGVDSPLGALGVADDGTVEVPADPDVAGWFTEGPRPGQRGPAVILGHVDSRSGPAVFAELATLVPGDRIEVGRADGTTARFAVDRLEQVPKDQFPSEAVYGPVPDAALRLITCGGDFDRATGHYRDNVVVYASLVG